MSTTDPINPPGQGDRPRLQALGPDDPAPRWRPTFWPADSLMAADFPEPKWAVPGLLCEGVSLLAGPPKVGKSWMALALGLAVASGSNALGSIPVRPGPVLYLALEDTPRRLQTRMGMLLDGAPAPAELTLATDWPALSAGGDYALAEWIDAHPDARMIVIDVFAKVRGPSTPGASAYDADYAHVGRAKRIADNYGLAIVLVHHIRKAGAEDFLETISGTNGIAGAADATLVLKRARGEHDGVLHVTGRDVEEAELAMRQDQHTKAWAKLDASPAELALGDTRVTILRWVREHPASTPKEITKGTGLGYETVRKTVARMTQDSQLTADSASRYYTPDAPFAGTAGAGVPGVPAVPTPEIPGLTCGDGWDTPAGQLSQRAPEEN